MPSTANSVTHRSEKPEHQSNDEHNHSDCPYSRNPRNEPNDEKNQTANNHNVSSISTYFSYCQPLRVRRFKRHVDERRDQKLLAARSVLGLVNRLYGLALRLFGRPFDLALHTAHPLLRLASPTVDLALGFQLLVASKASDGYLNLAL